MKIRIQRTRLAQALSPSARSPPSVCAATSSSNPPLGGKYERATSLFSRCVYSRPLAPRTAPARPDGAALAPSPLLPHRHARRDSPAAAQPPRPDNSQLRLRTNYRRPFAGLPQPLPAPACPDGAAPAPSPFPPRRRARRDSPTAARLPRPESAATLTNFNCLRPPDCRADCRRPFAGRPQPLPAPARPPGRPRRHPPPRRPLPQRRARHTPTTNPCQTRSSLPPKTLAPERRKPPSDPPPLEPYNIRENAPATSGGTSSRDGLLLRNNM